MQTGDCKRFQGRHLAMKTLPLSSYKDEGITCLLRRRKAQLARPANFPGATQGTLQTASDHSSTAFIVSNVCKCSIQQQWGYNREKSRPPEQAAQAVPFSSPLRTSGSKMRLKLRPSVNPL